MKRSKTGKYNDEPRVNATVSVSESCWEYLDGLAAHYGVSRTVVFEMLVKDKAHELKTGRMLKCNGCLAHFDRPVDLSTLDKCPRCGDDLWRLIPKLRAIKKKTEEQEQKKVKLRESSRILNNSYEEF